MRYLLSFLLFTLSLSLYAQRGTREYRWGMAFLRAHHYSDAIVSLRKAGKQGSEAAWTQLGILYEEGVGVKKNIPEALLCYERADRLGSSRAAYALFRLLASKEYRDTKRAIAALQRAAERGSIKGAKTLAQLYYTGDGVAKNLLTAAHWYERATAQGDTLSALLLGSMYQYGEGVAQDDSMALHYYRLAAEREEVAAMMAVATYYEEGKAVAKDAAQAHRWWEKAAAKGSATAHYKLWEQEKTNALNAAGAGENSSKTKLKAQLSEALSHLRAATRGGDARAQNDMAQLLITGQWLEQNKKRAVVLFDSAAQQRLPEAQTNMAKLYENGDGVAVNMPLALEYYSRAARGGYPEAQYNVARFFFLGKVVQKDERKAAMWFERAARGGYTIAQYNLALLYAKGWGVERDEKKAIEWMEKAAKSASPVQRAARQWLEERTKTAQ